MSSNIIDLEGQPIKDAELFPASKIVSWPSGPVFCCDDHVAQIVRIGQVMGVHVVVSYAPPGSQCSNCINESKKS